MAFPVWEKKKKNPDEWIDFFFLCEESMSKRNLIDAETARSVLAFRA